MDIQDTLNNLYNELKNLEWSIRNNILSHSDQQLMDQAWEDIMDQIAMYEDMQDLMREQQEAPQIAPPPPRNLFEEDNERLVSEAAAIWEGMTDEERDAINALGDGLEPCTCDVCRQHAEFDRVIDIGGWGGGYDGYDEI